MKRKFSALIVICLMFITVLCSVNPINAEDSSPAISISHNGPWKGHCVDDSIHFHGEVQGLSGTNYHWIWLFYNDEGEEDFEVHQNTSSDETNYYRTFGHTHEDWQNWRVSLKVSVDGGSWFGTYIPVSSPNLQIKSIDLGLDYVKDLETLLGGDIRWSHYWDIYFVVRVKNFFELTGDNYYTIENGYRVDFELKKDGGNPFNFPPFSPNVPLFWGDSVDLRQPHDEVFGTWYEYFNPFKRYRGPIYNDWNKGTGDFIITATLSYDDMEFYDYNSNNNQQTHWFEVHDPL